MPPPPPQTRDGPEVAGGTANVIVDEGVGDLWPTIRNACEPVRVRRAVVRTLLSKSRERPLAGVAAIVVGTRDADGSPAHVLVASIRARCPHVSIHVCGRRRDELLAMNAPFALAGATEILRLDQEFEVGRLAEAVRARALAPAPEALIGRVQREAREGLGRTIAVTCLIESFRWSRVQCVERFIGRYHKAINRGLRRAGVKPVGQVLRAGRLAHAQVLERLGVAAAERASRLGFESAKALSRCWTDARKSWLVRGEEFVLMLDSLG